MKYDMETGIVELCEDVRDEPLRQWEKEDLDHLLDALLEGHEEGCTAMPGLESVYRQIQLRLETQKGCRTEETRSLSSHYALCDALRASAEVVERLMPKAHDHPEMPRVMSELLGRMRRISRRLEESLS